jgi:hypothetical protein
VKEKMSIAKPSKSFDAIHLVLFALLLLLLPSSSITIFNPLDVYAQQETGIAAATNPTTNKTLPKLPEALVLTDNAMGDTQLPLRSSIINEKPTSELIPSKSGQGKLDEYFPIVAFHFKTSADFQGEGYPRLNHVLTGPIKSYDSSDVILNEANYWKDIPLNTKVALEIDHPGQHYLIASVQFANGTYGIYSGVMDVSAVGIKPSSNQDSTLFKIDESRAASLEFTQMDQSDIEVSESDPVFQQIASQIICSDLSDYGFELCQNGNEDTILEDEDEDEDDNDEGSKNDSDNDEDVEVRGDGGKDGKYDKNNCTGEQCEDADRETEQERDSDYCDIDPSYCKDKEDSDGNSGDDNEEENDQNEDK